MFVKRSNIELAPFLLIICSFQQVRVHIERMS